MSEQSGIRPSFSYSVGECGISQLSGAMACYGVCSGRLPQLMDASSPPDLGVLNRPSGESGAHAFWKTLAGGREFPTHYKRSSRHDYGLSRRVDAIAYSPWR